MVGPQYTEAQTRARVAALEIAAAHLEELDTFDCDEATQTADVILKLRNEATRLKARRQAVRHAR